MKRYKIKESFRLNGKLLNIGRFYKTEDEGEQKQLEQFVQDGSAEELSVGKHDQKNLKPAGEQSGKPVEKKEEQKEEKKSTQDPEEDITVVKGVGKTLQDRLASLENPVTTVSGLKENLDREDVKEALGNYYDEVKSYFAE